MTAIKFSSNKLEYGDQVGYVTDINGASELLRYWGVDETEIAAFVADEALAARDTAAAADAEPAAEFYAAATPDTTTPELPGMEVAARKYDATELRRLVDCVYQEPEGSMYSSEWSAVAAYALRLRNTLTTPRADLEAALERGDRAEARCGMLEAQLADLREHAVTLRDERDDARRDAAFWHGNAEALGSVNAKLRPALKAVQELVDGLRPDELGPVDAVTKCYEVKRALARILTEANA